MHRIEHGLKVEGRCLGFKFWVFSVKAHASAIG